MGNSIRDIPVVNLVLRPFSWLYGAVTDLRNLCYDQKWLRVHEPPCNTISVGNITVGGTGKTPMIETLVRLLKDRHRITIVSRGYGRKSRGLLVANRDSSPLDIGDEPMQFYRKFAPDVRVIVAEKRVEAARKIEDEFPGTTLLLLDDAYQHRAINRHVNILLTDYNRLFFEDYPFPAGNLRERRKGARRADIVVVTKCPGGLSAHQKVNITTRIHHYTTGKPDVFFSTIRYAPPIPYNGNRDLEEFRERIGLSGLARNTPFEEFLKKKYGIKSFFSFPDHHDYTQQDIPGEDLAQNPDLALITTEKDMVKLLPIAEQLAIADRCFYVPIETGFGSEEERLLKEITKICSRQNRR